MLRDLTCKSNQESGRDCLMCAIFALRLGRRDAVATRRWPTRSERDFFFDSLLVRVHFIVVMIRWPGLALWDFEFPLPGSRTSTFLGNVHARMLEVVARFETGFDY